MEIFIKLSILLMFLMRKVASDDCSEHSNTKEITEFIEDQNKNYKDTIKSDIDEFFDKISSTMDKKFEDINSEMDKRFSEMTDSFNSKMTTFETRLVSEVQTGTDVTSKFQQQMSNLVPTRTVVKELSGTSGTIEFLGGTDNQPRRIWILQNEVGFFNSDVQFMMEENNLGEGAYLTIWSSHGSLHMFNGTQDDSTSERWAKGGIIMVTFTKQRSQPGVDRPGFKLSYKVTREPSTHPVFSNQILTKDGVNSVSFPPNNEQNYLPKSNFQAVIAPASGRSFTLSLKYIDVPGDRPKCPDNYFLIYFLEETSNGANYKKLDTSEYKECGQEGNVSDVIGHGKVAIVRFLPEKTTLSTGTGFRLEVDTE